MDNISRQKVFAERGNTITHAIGAVLALIGMVVLLTTASTTLEVVSFVIFGLSMIVLYLSSASYHALSFTRFAGILQKLDHVSIFILIAGSYTPFALLAIGGRAGIIITAVAWSIALGGTLTMVLFKSTPKLLRTILYLAMGWMIIFFFKPFVEAVSTPSLICTALGGLFYSGGTAFYLQKKRPLMHVVWHVFVMLGTVFVFFGVLLR